MNDPTSLDVNTTVHFERNRIVLRQTNPLPQEIELSSEALRLLIEYAENTAQYKAPETGGLGSVTGYYAR